MTSGTPKPRVEFEHRGVFVMGRAEKTQEIEAVRGTLDAMHEDLVRRIRNVSLEYEGYENVTKHYFVEVYGRRGETEWLSPVAHALATGLGILQGGYELIRAQTVSGSRGPTVELGPYVTGGAPPDATMQ